MSRIMQARIDDDKFDRFEKIFPMEGAKQWFIEACVNGLLNAIDKGLIEPPAEIPIRVVETDLSHL